MSSDTANFATERLRTIYVGRLRDLVFSFQNGVFLFAVLAMNYTLMRPSPVDLLFLLTFLVSVSLIMLDDRRRVTARSLVFLVVVGIWVLSFLMASLPHYQEDNVVFELISKLFAVTIGVVCAFVPLYWTRKHFETFMKFYIASSVIGAILGTIGFLLQHPMLTWDGRAKGFIDDPNMYGTFLIPGMMFCAYFLYNSRRYRLLLLGSLALILLGVLLSFSRIAVVAAVVCLFAYLVMRERKRPQRLILGISVLVLAGTVLMVFASLTSSEFTEKLLDRLTFAKSYDLGEQGRYNRYLLVLPMIMENPLGLGVLQLDKIFPEPIHNIWLSSFVNYGWGGGFSWILLVSGSVIISVLNYRRTRSDIPIVLLLSLIGPILGASLHEGEHWRQMWMHFGLIWGLDPSILNRGFPSGEGVKRPPNVKIRQAGLPTQAVRPIAATQKTRPQATVR
ncbi:MAG: hypothetical protein ABS75_11485 [Pelagibacterium sp. SCN 63-23]|mgnify:CR=1 FL=1|nr:MAG: hypothetical protein ABS75_11485 [Pelagibacterium sp. SCN 63-23]